MLAVVGQRGLDRGGLGSQLARSERRLADGELEQALGSGALDLSVGADQLLGGKGLARVDAAQHPSGYRSTLR